MLEVLTGNPNIVLARPPKRIRRKAAQQKRAMPAVTIAGPRKVGPIEDDDPNASAEAAERLWREMVESVSRKSRSPRAAALARTRLKEGPL